VEDGGSAGDQTLRTYRGPGFVAEAGPLPSSPILLPALLSLHANQRERVGIF
jgi:hypothetical protein